MFIHDHSGYIVFGEPRTQPSGHCLLITLKARDITEDRTFRTACYAGNDLSGFLSNVKLKDDESAVYAANR